jgi:hypothetical protein
MAIIASTLARIKSDPLSCLGGKDRVNQHFARAGHCWRETLAARREDVSDANRISFIDTLRCLCCRIVRGSPPGQPTIDLIVNPIRPGRWHPRVKKRRMKEYDLMNRPRSEYAEPSELEAVMI